MAEAAKIEDAAEKAYAAAAEKVVVKPDDVKPVVAKAVEPAPAVVSAPAKVGALTPVAAKPVVAPKPAAAEKAVKAKPAAAPAKRKYVRKAITPAKSTAAKPVAPKVAVKAKPAARQSAVKITTPTKLVTKLKEATMATTVKKTTEDFSSKIQDAVKDAQERAKTAFEKSQAAMGEANEFSKGNLEALVETGKVLASGMQTMGKSYVAEVKSAFETMQADAKELTSVKSPKDFVELQSKLARKYFDSVVAYNSKSAEAALKLANEAFQPISSRVSLAVEKVRKAA